jgi:hypothetical protein
MPTLLNREDFKEYCLRKLGKGVITINVSTDQIEDRVDDAFEYYRDYHYDAVEKVFMKHILVEDDFTNRYIPINDTIIGVKRVIPLTQLHSNNMFSIEYQMRLNDVYHLNQLDLISYKMAHSYMSLINDLLHTTNNIAIRYNRHLNKLSLDMDWNKLSVGDIIIIEVMKILDPDTYTDVWNDRWLKEYATALIKHQWGENISKYEGVEMVGGVMLSGARLIAESTEMINKLQEEMSLKYELPCDFMVG